MIAPILVLAALAAGPSPRDRKPAPAATRSAAAETPRPSSLELVIPEKMIEDFLLAASPYERTITTEIALLGLTQRVQVNLIFRNPRVKVTPKGVLVTMDYEAHGPGGLSSRGTATPRLELRALPDQDVLEGRLTGAKLSGTGDLEIGIDELIEPVRIPAGISGPIDLDGKQVIAQGHAREVVLEDGVVRVKGDWSFQEPAVAGDGPK
ncbi:MAG: hypothetical protein IRZ16_19180 [Myxococcaceae bacterium]|nr:hypothetical protein [Myxococcaceae bacterium]